MKSSEKSKQDSLVGDVFEKSNEMEKRSANLIVDNSKSLEERKEANRSFVGRVLSYLELESPEIRDIRRIGNPGQQHLLRVKYRNILDKQNVFSKASLRNCLSLTPYTCTLYINPDRTYLIIAEEKIKIVKKLLSSVAGL